MTREEIIDLLKPIIVTYAPADAALDHITEESDFIRDLKINSANLVDIVLDVEEKFGITIADDEMEKMLTIKAVIDIISEKLK